MMNPSKSTKNIARCVMLASSIHKQISEEEQKRKAAIDAANLLVAQMNATMQQPIHDALEFFEVLNHLPALHQQFSQTIQNLTELFHDKINPKIEGDRITVRCTIPHYKVDMAQPDHYVLCGERDARLSLAVHPISFALFNQDQGGTDSITKSLIKKEYLIKIEQGVAVFYTPEQAKTDPVAELLTELRHKLGYDFFEQEFLPYMQGISHEQERDHNL